jgi:hypothetical protein
MDLNGHTNKMIPTTCVSFKARKVGHKNNRNIDVKAVSLSVMEMLAKVLYWSTTHSWLAPVLSVEWPLRE